MTLGMPQAWSRVARQYRQRIAPDFLPAARRLCRAIGIGANDRVLDIACGPGTAAFAALEAGAREVVGVDFAAEMIAGATRDAAGRPARFAVTNALALPLRGGGFDVVVSSFGLVFVPEPRVAAAEAARGLRRGGRLGAHDPFQWGVPAQARAWLVPEFAEIAVAAVEVPFDADSPEAAWELLRSATGRVAAAYQELGPGQRARLDHEMIGFFGPFRLPDGRVHWPREALIVTARRS